MTPEDVAIPSLKGRVSDAEWGARVELAAAYRLIALLGQFDLTMPGVSLKVPGEPYYLFNPAQLLFEEITASSLLKVTIDGEIIGETPFTYVPGSWYPAKAVHEARQDANCVFHSHDKFGAALSARKERLLPISQTSGFLIAGGIAYHDYEGVETYADQIPALQRSLGATAVTMIMHNHGLVALGPDVYTTFMRMDALRYACEVQVLAGRGSDLIQFEPEMIGIFREELRRGPAIANSWPALLRKLDRIDRSYRL